MHVPVCIVRLDQKAARLENDFLTGWMKLDQNLQRLEHDFVVASQKIIGNPQMFGAVVLWAFITLSIIVLVMFASNSSTLKLPTGPY